MLARLARFLAGHVLAGLPPAGLAPAPVRLPPRRPRA